MGRFILPLGLALVTAVTLAPTTVRANNREIAHQIASVMKATGAMKNYDIVVTFSEGQAKLQGTVTNEQQMKTAIAIAQASPHVDKVVNQLALAPIAPTATAIRPAAPLSRPVRLSPVALSAQPTMQPPARATPTPQATAPALQQPVFPQQVPQQQPVFPQQVLQQQQLAALRAVPAKTALQSSRRAPTRPVAVAPSNLAVAQPTFRQPPQPRQAVPMQVAMAGAAPMAAMAAAPMAAMGGMAAPRPMMGGPQPAYVPGTGGGVAPAGYDQPQMPAYAWPTYAPYPNYAALTYPKQYSPTAWPYIGPFYPYPQVPLGWRKVTLEWDDGWWFLDFKNK